MMTPTQHTNHIFDQLLADAFRLIWKHGDEKDVDASLRIIEQLEGTTATRGQDKAEG